MYDDRYKDRVKYDWLTIKGMDIKVYHQKRTVNYADYKVGKYYVSVHDVEGEIGMNEKDLIGKTIEKIDIDGYGVEIRFTDGTEFVYNATDAGYSSWDISKER